MVYNKLKTKIGVMQFGLSSTVSTCCRFVAQSVVQQVRSSLNETLL